MDDRLPRRAAELVAEWGLVPEGPPLPGARSTLLPVLDAAGAPCVLKVGRPGVTGSQHEALALQRWAGRRSARLLRADPRRRALLLERLLPHSLVEEWDVAACEVVGGLYRDLHRPAPPQVGLLSDLVERRTAELAALPAGSPLPHRLVEQAVSLGRDMAGTGDGRPSLLHTDLHHEHVLAAEREPWLVVAPRPLAGDPHYEVAPLLLHRWDELAGDVRGGVRRRFHAVVDAASFDEDRARDWVVVRMLHNALQALTEDPRQATARTRRLLTACVAVAKAVQD